jgi:hypothetical protein
VIDSCLALAGVHLPCNRRTLLKQDQTTKLELQGKRLKAGWDNDYLLRLLGIEN